jgi:hypothetical protein
MTAAVPFSGTLRALGSPRGLTCNEHGWTAWGDGWLAQGVGAAVRLWPLHGVVDVSASPGGAVALLSDGRVVAPDGTPVRPGNRLAGVQVRLGDPWATAFEGGDWTVYDWRAGSSLKAPIGAVRPRPGQPGAGLLWIDETTLYRLDERGVRVAASLPCPASSWEHGPLGAACFELGDAVGVCAPRAPLRILRQDLVAAGARFSPDGERALLASTDGAAVVDLRAGQVIDVATGVLRPVGFGPQPVVWDEEAHTLRELGGAIVLDGLCGARPDLGAGLLVGPAAGCWDLDTGELLWVHSCLERGIAVLVGDLVACVGRSEVVWMDRDGQLVSWVDIDPAGAPVDATADGEAVVVWFLGGALRVGRVGPDLNWTAPPVPPPPALRVRGPDRGHLWTDEGLLMSLEPAVSRTAG